MSSGSRTPTPPGAWCIAWTRTIVIAQVFSKKTQATPKPVIEACKRRLKVYDAVTDGEED